jgi:hypothetical protein
MALVISVLEVSRDLESESECVPRMISITLNNLWATKGFPLLTSGYINLLLSCKPLSCEKGSDFVFENRSPDCDTLHVVTGI